MSWISNYLNMTVSTNEGSPELIRSPKSWIPELTQVNCPWIYLFAWHHSDYRTQGEHTFCVVMLSNFLSKAQQMPLWDTFNIIMVRAMESCRLQFCHPTHFLFKYQIYERFDSTQICFEGLIYSQNKLTSMYICTIQREIV